jgi:hypothetical protein
MGQAGDGPTSIAANSPPASSPRVSSTRRRAVNHAGDRATSQARMPVAPAPAAIAPAMHCMHIASGYAADATPGAAFVRPAASSPPTATEAFAVTR